MNEYKEFLKHFDIKPGLMVADMRSRLPDSEKPMFVSGCKEFEVCKRVKNKGCSGCNVWNYLNDIKTLHKWCKKHNKDFMQYALKMKRHLEE